MLVYGVNSHGSPNIESYDEGDGCFCIMLPDKWTPGLKAHDEKDVYPNMLENTAVSRCIFCPVIRLKSPLSAMVTARQITR